MLVAQGRLQKSAEDLYTNEDGSPNDGGSQILFILIAPLEFVYILTLVVGLGLARQRILRRVMKKEGIIREGPAAGRAPGVMDDIELGPPSYGIEDPLVRKNSRDGSSAASGGL